jgi:hypothetical protein
MPGGAAERLDGLLAFGQLADALYRPVSGHARVGAVGTAERGHEDSRRGQHEPPGEQKGQGSGISGHTDAATQGRRDSETGGRAHAAAAPHLPPEQPVRLALLEWEPLATYTPDRHLNEPILAGKQCDWRA